MKPSSYNFPDRPVRLLECIRQGQIGGGESHLLSLVENLDRGKFEPTVLSFTDGPMVGRLREMGVDTHIIYTEKPFDVSKWGRVKGLLKELQIEMVHAHGTRACSNVLQPARSLGIPVVYTVHGWSFHADQRPLVQGVRVWGERYLTGRSAMNISVSASNRQTGSDRMRGFESAVISNGIDRAKFDPQRSFKDIRSELGIPADALLVIFVARFTGHKQPLNLIRAFKDAAGRMPYLHLLMVGDGDQKAEGVKMASEFGLDSRVTFQSFRQDVPDLLAAADIFVLPSLWEGLPIGLLEAMSMGKAVIATHVDGSKEVVKDDHNGTLIEPGDPAALSAAILRLGGDADLRRSFGRAAMETVREAFDAVVMTRKIEEVYTDIYRRQAKPGVVEYKKKSHGV